MFTSSEKSTFRNMIAATRSCLNTSNPKNHADKVKCETAYFSELGNFTYHTHPVGVPYPSETDRKTTARFKKKYLVIGLVPNNEVIVWGVYPKYDKVITRFKV